MSVQGASTRSGRNRHRMFYFLLCLMMTSQVMAQQTDLISKGAVIPWRRDVAKPDRIADHFEQIHFPNCQGFQLRAWYFPCAEATKTILVCSGNTGNISLSLPYAKLLLDGGFNVMLFDYQGFGGSEGIASVMSLCTDTEAAFNYLLNEKNLKADDIGVFGISLGSILALMIAHQEEAGAVAVEDVFIPEQMLEQFGVSENDPNVMKGMAIRLAKKVLLGRVDPIQNAKNCECPILFMHGLNDRLLPFYGTVQVAKELKSKHQVWLMDKAGHAPETLEVNDREYAAQLIQFFQASMQKRFSPLKLQFETQQVANRYYANRLVNTPIFKTTVTLPEAPDLHTEIRPVQLVFVDKASRYRVVRAMMSTGETRTWNLPFKPVFCSATEFQYVSPNQVQPTTDVRDIDSERVHEWNPELSEFSGHRAALMQWSLRFFKSSAVAHHLMTNYGRNFFRASRYVQGYPSSEVQRLMAFLKVDPDRPPEICARYARLLARLYCWPSPTQTNRQQRLSNDIQRVQLVEKMLELLPKNPDDYFELGNASFQYQFRDAVISDALFRLARIRLRDGDVDEGRKLLKLHVQLLPAKVSTKLTPGRIALISTVADLDGPEAF